MYGEERDDVELDRSQAKSTIMFEDKILEVLEYLKEGKDQNGIPIEKSELQIISPKIYLSEQIIQIANSQNVKKFRINYGSGKYPTVLKLEAMSEYDCKIWVRALRNMIKHLYDNKFEKSTFK